LIRPLPLSATNRIRLESARPRRSRSLNSASQISCLSEAPYQNPKAILSPLRSPPSATRNALPLR
jgi:hypothetical protein